MAIYHLTNDSLIELRETNFGDEGIRERDDLQRLIRNKVEIISPDTLVIAEEFGQWEMGIPTHSRINGAAEQSRSSIF